MTSLFNHIYQKLIVNQLRELYLHGPSVLGFWGGQSPSQICQTVTTYTELFWQSNPKQCNDIIESKFAALRVTIEIILYFLFLYHISRQIGVVCLYMMCRANRKKQARLKALHNTHGIT